MGIYFSCPFADYNDVESDLDSIIVKSISFGDDEVKTPVRSISFNNRNLEPTISKSDGSGKMILEGSVSFKESELEALMSQMSLSSQEKQNGKSIVDTQLDTGSPRLDRSKEPGLKLPFLDPKNPKHEAAIKLQKVYKSFRTRRKLADCAVLVEQSWWKLLDFAELKRSSISYFDIKKHETAISRWSRARTRAAKVGKGLSKNDKAQKLALQHWLEAIDPRHRYGHNLHFYYENWLHSQSREPFFYWLDIGEGKEVNLDICSRSKLQQQCIKYLGPMERKAYEVDLVDGKFFYKQTGELLHTAGDLDTKWIFVLSTSKTLYVGRKKKGTFQHSSFLAGGATTAAGRLIVENGTLKAVWPHSGHYRPTEQNFKEFISFLEENNVDLTDVQMSPADEAESIDGGSKRISMHIRSGSSDEDFIDALKELESHEPNNEEDGSLEKADSVEQEISNASSELPRLRFQTLGSKLTNLEIPKKADLFETFDNESPVVEPSYNDDTAEESPLTGKMQEENTEVEETVPDEAILQRINSHKGMKSYQLGKQLSCKWTTGAGPRIGCVRDYPSELQFRALEEVKLSPRRVRDSGPLRTSSCITLSHAFSLSPKEPSSMCCGVNTEAAAGVGIQILDKGIMLRKTTQHSRTTSSPLRRRHN